jgi:hypothetical protein
MNELNQIDLMDDETHMDKRLGAFLTEASLMTSEGDFTPNKLDELNWMDASDDSTDDFLMLVNDDKRSQTPPSIPPQDYSSDTDIFLSPLQDKSLSPDNDYQKAIDQLRASMKRSEEIICNQLLLQQSTPTPELLPSSLEFCTGS